MHIYKRERSTVNEQERPEDTACVPQWCELNCVCEKENQSFLLTQNTITEIFKYVIGFCALKYGDEISIAISLENPVTWLISSDTG